MLESPAKRRKIGTPEAELDTAERPLHTAAAQPTTPRRASYRSPTKSSLARSHPHLVNAAIRPVLTASRGRSLRDEILNQAPSVPEGLRAVSRIPQQVDSAVDDSTTLPADGEQANLLQRRNGASSVGSPFKERSPSHTNPSEGRRVDEDPQPPAAITPTLVRKAQIDANVPTSSHSDDPELPPTPVQLGLSAAPDRPRGLPSSSSPRRSISGSGKNRRRVRTDGTVISSPLKPKMWPPADDGGVTLASGQDEVVEAQESEPDVQLDEDLPDELKEKQSTLRSLRERLHQVKRENGRLETVIEGAEEITTEGMSLLGEAYLGSGTAEHDYANLGDKSLSYYLKLFAPGNVQLSTRTECRRVKGRTKAIHLLTITAPPPWLPDVFACRLEVVVDTEEVRVEHVGMADILTDKRRTSSTMLGVHKWLSDRLKDPLHCLDVGGMVGGIGRYFAATIERAKIFQQLDKQFDAAMSGSEEEVSEEINEAITQDKAIKLSRWLGRSQLQVPIATSSGKTGSREPKAHVMLIWDMDLDWAGCVSSNVTLSVGGVPAKAETRLKDAFCGLLPSTGVMGAFRGAYRLVEGTNEDVDAAKN